MRFPATRAFYAALLLLSNAAAAQDLSGLATGDMRKLVVSEPAEVSRTEVEGADGAPATLADLKGKPAVVNFWATWCAPCRREMPTLAKLQAAVGDSATVAVVAVGRNDPAEIDRFLAEAGADTLTRWRDPRQQLARDMGILGLPVTVILDAEGREVARLVGDADWSSDSAKAIVAALAGG